MSTPTTKHVQATALEIHHFLATYQGKPVKFSRDDIYTDGIIVRARGNEHFGTVWTSDGVEEITVTEAQPSELKDIEAVLTDGRNVTPEEYRLWYVEQIHPVDEAQAIERKIDAELDGRTPEQDVHIKQHFGGVKITTSAEWRKRHL